jgi:hypothetical protein
MFVRRAIDPALATHYRSKRVSTVNGQFFFSTREGTFEGPYFTQDDAEREIAYYIRRMRQSDDIRSSKV